MRGLRERRQPRGHQTMRQRRLIDHADRPAVRLEPDAAHGFAVDFHGFDLARLPRAGEPAYVACRHWRQMPMAALDLETEYSPRVTVTDHAEIFARWAREAENYRADMLKSGKV